MTDFPPISPELRAYNPEDKTRSGSLKVTTEGACKQGWGTRKGSWPIPRPGALPSPAPWDRAPHCVVLSSGQCGKLISFPPQEYEPPLKKGESGECLEGSWHSSLRYQSLMKSLSKSSFILGNRGLCGKGKGCPFPPLPHHPQRGPWVFLSQRDWEAGWEEQLGNMGRGGDSRMGEPQKKAGRQLD